MTQIAHGEARNLSGLFEYPVIKKIGTTLLDLVFPPVCVHCGRVDTIFCHECLDLLAQQPVLDYMRPFAPLVVIGSTGLHEGLLQAAVQALKYHQMRSLAQPLGLRLARCFHLLDWTIDTIIPVPLHSSRLRERGYNQSQEMASVLSEILRKPCLPHAIQRVRATQSQVALSRSDRLTNLEQAFRAEAHEVAGQVLLLVDDVQTTGSTLSSCAQAALEAGASAVYGITVTTAHI